MASHIANSAILVLGLISTVACFTPVPSDNIPQAYDICSPESSPPSSLLSKPGDFIEVFVKWPSTSITKDSYSCTANYETCDRCRIKVTAVEPQFSYPDCQQKTGNKDRCVRDCVCLILRDADYKLLHFKRVSQSKAVDGFESISKRLQIVACGNHVYSFNVTMRLRLTSVEKVEIISGRRTITSPGFPNPYVQSNEQYTYRFLAASINDYVTLTFDDWILAPYSSLQFDGAKFVNRIYGNSDRPYVISKGQSMNMTFNTGEPRRVGANSSYLGFKAVARFYSGYQNVPRIETGCDQVVNKSEGGILHLNSITDGLDRDCIWVIKKLPGFDGVYMKILRYRTRYELIETCSYSVEVRSGLTSTAEQLLKIKPNENYLSNAVQVSEDGFYIRVKGCYLDDSLVISYAMYLNDCDDYREYYKCDNHQCIPEKLRCDTFDHCGDNSDEIRNMCGRSSMKFKPGFGDKSTNNVSNTSSGSYDYSLSIHVIIPLVVAIVLGIGIICVLIILIRRCRHLSNTTLGRCPARVQQTRGRNRCWRNRGVRMSVTMSSGEHPPSYEDVIRSTPIGHLNMAFSWSPCDNTFTQPPSYEEAVTATSSTPQQPDGVITNPANGSTEYLGEAITSLPQFNSLPALTSTLSDSLDQQEDLLSSSPEQSSGNYHMQDILSPSENSAIVENYQFPIPHGFNNFKTSSNLHKESNSEVNSQKYKFRNETKDVRDCTVYSKEKDNNLDVNYGKSWMEKEPTDCVRDNRDKHQQNQITVDDTARDAVERYNQSPNAVGVFCFSQNLDGEDADQQRYQDTDDRVENCRDSCGERRSERERYNIGLENTNHVPVTDVEESPGFGDCFFMDNNGLSACSARAANWSRSCSDLSLDVRENPRDMLEKDLDDDKRFSYAGVGDISLLRRGLDSTYGSRSLVTDGSNERGCNLRGGYRGKKHRTRRYETDTLDDGNVPDKW